MLKECLESSALPTLALAGKPCHGFRYLGPTDGLGDESHPIGASVVAEPAIKEHRPNHPQHPEYGEGDVIEEEIYDAKTKQTEKRISKYNSLSEKTEEQVFDGTGQKIKTHYYTYNSKGLKTERKTLDPAGKIISVRKYTYEYK